ncbi:MAG TPA: peptide-methionine (R)-S-oxide reductase MsrB [Allosphingosinicella sp.]|jgi:peptide-methionine (R)-S-oxide reductase|uniref:peptide-methionine (R)-S-oxide reductase MsrB n=1 Tax=Allosphingosinicella sp. TaxID=2823234 RepID=UPI002F287033
MVMDRRTALGLGGAAIVGAAATLTFGRQSHAAPGKFEVSYTDAEWRKRLNPRVYAVLRKENTEPAGSSPLNKEKRRGTYHCAGCDLPVYSSAQKFESGTGWPSFWKPLPNAIGTREDNQLFISRTEVHCRRCGGHLGHVFDDGPKPTGLRYCMNGLALKFRPA